MCSDSPDLTPSEPAQPVILVVEDEAMVGEVVCAMLQLGGFDFVHAEGPFEALDILKDTTQHIDLLLTDFRMPRMTGIELIQQTPSLRPGLKSILYSGNADESVVRGYKVQPARFLSKPFTPKTLNDLVRAVLTA